MKIAKTICITLPPDLLRKAQKLAAHEHRTMSELFREALRHYMAKDEAGYVVGRRQHGDDRDSASGKASHDQGQHESGPTVVHSFRMEKPRES